MSSFPMVITKQDIQYAEKKLLPAGKSFDDERCAFIEHLESCDVVACPGSGKTTALLAKLLILSRKMPFSNGGGVCVLTHTNVAIDEIKGRLGAESGKLLAYPNFFGTIQSFVDRFMTIPCYRERFGKNLVSINTEQYLKRLEQVCMLSDARFWLPKQVSKQNPSISSVLARIVFNENLEFDFSPLNLKTTGSKTYRALLNSVRKVMDSGVISYEQAYSFAIYYLEKHNCLSDIMSERFPFVLVDEMQDTDAKQISIMESVFSSGGTILQCVGDPNQAISEV